MKLKQFMFWVILPIFVIIGFFPAGSVRALTEATAYRAAVRIIVYVENDNGYLTEVKTGAGAIIDPGGIILTSADLAAVKDGSGAEITAAFAVCPAVDLSVPPDCRLAADLIAFNEARQVALLKIRPVPGLSSQTDFFHLNRKLSSPRRIGERVRRIEFMAGQSGVFSEPAFVAEIEDRYGLDWVKLDAGFGAASNGGLVVNRDGDLTGLTTAAFADAAGADGYVLHLPPHNSWIDQNLNTAPADNPLAGRLDVLLAKQRGLEDDLMFTNDEPAVTLTRIQDWEFAHQAENRIRVFNPVDSDKGFIEISWQDWPEMNTADYNEKLMEAADTGFEPIGDKTLAGHAGKEFLALEADPVFYRILVPVENYLFTLDYGYGQDGQDEAAVKAVLDSMIIEEEIFAPEQTAWPEEPAEEEPSLPADETEAPAGEPASPPAAEGEKLAPRPLAGALGARLKGRILLEVERAGQAWYLSPQSGQAHFLGRPSDAFAVMREQGIGITNADLEKIPAGTLDAAVVPAAPNEFAARHLGKIFLAVEENGEAWYINPINGQRYFLGRPADAFAAMRSFGLGISAADFAGL